MEDNNDKKECPFCGEKINKEAKKCRFCGNWLDEEILCPYCAEKIKASAKKCRFCGEWLNKDDSVNNDEQNNESKKQRKVNFGSILKNKITIIVGIIVLLCLLIGGYVLYIPGCNNSSVQAKLKDYLISNYSDISDISLNQSSAYKLKKIDKGYSCSIDANIDNTPTKIEYNYKRVSFNELDMNAKFVLPNCFDSTVKDLLGDLIMESDQYSIKDNTADVTTKYEKQDSYDKISESYKCSADAILTSKPGKAYLLQPWDYDVATRKLKCKVDYKSYFCENGYTTCVGITDLYGCEYEDE